MTQVPTCKVFVKANTLIHRKRACPLAIYMARGHTRLIVQRLMSGYILFIGVFTSIDSVQYQSEQHTDK